MALGGTVVTQPGKEMNVLIVDDQSSARTMLRRVIEDISPEIVVTDFEDPLEALSWTLSHDTDLLLLDYRMPELDGIEFARRFRENPARRDVPIVLITVVGEDPVRQSALDAGVIDFLVKPIRSVELRSRCRNLLQLRKQTQGQKQRAGDLEVEVLQGIQKVEQREREMLFRLAKAVESRDNATAAHLERMARYAGLIAEAIGMPEDEVRMLETAAPLHDIGKIAVPDAILHKPGRLTEAEMAVMREHPRKGYEILSGSSIPFIQLGAEIALYHHERWDGSGYPAGLAGEQIPLSARIVAIADVLDALTTARPYKAAWSLDEAVAYMQSQSGAMFEPRLVDALLAQLDRIDEVRIALAPV